MTTFVLGLDGADWSLLDRLGADGSLPAFDRVLQGGTAGDLRSTVPPLTSPAWQSFATGKNPGSLGVYGWMTYDDATNDIGFADATNYRSERFWDVLARNGFRVGVVNVPTTYPTECADGVFLVAGNGTRRDRDFTSPDALREEVLDLVPEYRIQMAPTVDKSDPDELLAEARELFDQRMTVARWLAEEKDCDVVVVTLFATDTIQHELWGQPSLLAPAYEHVDDLLGGLLDDPETDAVFLVSDHGFTETEERFHPNQWLLERGDVVLGRDDTENELRDRLHEAGVTRERFIDLFDRLGIDGIMERLVPDAVRRLVPHQDALVPIHEADVDWAHTRAVALGHGPIFANRDAFETDGDLEAYLSSLEGDLRSLRNPDGDPVVAAVHRPGDLWAETAGSPPALLVEYVDGVDASKVGVGGPVFDRDGFDDAWAGMHRRTGVFAAYGDGIAAGRTDAGIEDVAPTLLHYLGVPVPADVDGDVLTGILEGGAADRAIESGPPTGREAAERTTHDDVEETLRDLGYLG